ACSILLDGRLVKSCMLLAIQADGSAIETVESLSGDGELTSLQQAFSDQHALQCGYCTPGMLMSATALLRANRQPTEEQIRKAIQGNICRCTGYVNIVKAIQAASGGGDDACAKCTSRSSSRRPRPSPASSGRTSRARRTSASFRARASSSTT